MTTDRCHACGAAVTQGAPWCTLCYADLRPKPAAPAPEEPIAVSAASHELTPRLEQPAPLAPPVHELPPDPILDGPGPIPVSALTYSAVTATLAPPAPVTDRAQTDASATWPCLGCGAVMSLDDDFCTQCGRPFLPAEGAPSLHLPIVGNVGPLDTTQRVWLMVIGAIVSTVAFFVLALVFGSIL